MVLNLKEVLKETGCNPHQAKVLLSTEFLEDGAPAAAQETTVELWGLLSDWIRDRPPSETSPTRSEEELEESRVESEEGQLEPEEQLPCEGLQLSHDFLGQLMVSEVAVGGGHCILVTECGRAFGYGCNIRGQLGLPGQDATDSVQELPVLRGKERNERGLDLEDFFVLGAACGSEHTLLLARPARSSSSRRQVFVCGAWEALGLPETDKHLPTALPLRHDVSAIAARHMASCCAVSEESGRHLLYLWGEVDCCPCPDHVERPTPCFRLPAPARKLCLGGAFGLALDLRGEVYAWGDGTYGELGDAVMDGSWSLSNRASVDPDELPAPGKVTLPLGQEKSDKDRPKEVIDIACGERHSLLLDEEGRLFAFGENLAGQCGVPEAVGSGHITGCTVQQPRLVPIEAVSSENAPFNERGAKVFAGKWHSAMVTVDHRLYIWGHPSNRKLGHAGFNHDGTEAGEDPGVGKQKSKARPPGVAVRSALRDAIRRPRMVFALLHRRVRTLGLGEECTVIVHGDGMAAEEEPAMEVRGDVPEIPNLESFQSLEEDLEAALPLPDAHEALKEEEAMPDGFSSPKDTHISL
ncbi:unnamed protein product [Effrenium voratum]|nr:unnamed protein product [Effrenium voratum]